MQPRDEFDVKLTGKINLWNGSTIGHMDLLESSQDGSIIGRCLRIENNEKYYYCYC